MASRLLALGGCGAVTHDVASLRLVVPGPTSCRVATRNAQLAGDAAARRDISDQHQRLAALAGEGAGVVGQLVGLVEWRDAQVAALKGQMQVDRQLLATD